MPRFAANLSLLFCERPLLERPAAAAEQGFKAIELLFPYDTPAEAMPRNPVELPEHWPASGAIELKHVSVSYK